MKNESNHFWSFAGTHFTYFFIWATVFGFLLLWLQQVADLDGTQAGIIFSFMAFVSLFYQPIFGILSDKLAFKKNLLITITIAGMFIGPFFQWLFIPLLSINTFFGAIIGSIYLAFVLNGGVGVVETYVERASLVNKFEYGHSRLGGSIAGAVAAFVGGIIFTQNPNSIFWLCSFMATILTGLVIFGDKVNLKSSEVPVEEKNEVTRKEIFTLFKNKNFWLLCLFFVGTAAIYDVVDQQFAIYYRTFFHEVSQGTIIYSRLLSIQVALEAMIMIPMPSLINKIGAKKGMILFGCLIFIRVMLSALAPNWIVLSGARLIAAVEMPLLLVSVMKYISGAFDWRLSATVYLLGFNFSKQISVFAFSTIAGKMYDSIGFKETYIFLAVLVLVVTVVGAIGLKNPDKRITPVGLEKGI
ncbi:TPA: oligosaccharide MFS transporter [Enterococcus faecium]